MMLNANYVISKDKNKVYTIYEEWPRFAKEGMERDINTELDPSSIVIAGMGGSGTIGDIIYDLLQDKSMIPIYAIKGYHLPSFIDDNSLAIIISSSGNTEEALSVFTEAHNKGLQIIGISSSGLLEKACKNHNYIHIKVNERLAPRYSLPEMLFVTLNIISSIDDLKWIKDQAKNAIDSMNSTKDMISINNNDNNIAKDIALCIKTIPIIYTSPYLKSVGIRFKNSLNENSKIIAIASDIVEASHNEIAALVNNQFTNILIRDTNNFEIEKRFDIFKSMLGNNIYEIKPIYSNRLANLVSLIYILDYSTIYLAILRSVDPLIIEPINRLKSMLGTDYINILRSNGLHI
jgi:glucose/mannose-6-phosphate isomerase